MTGGMLSMVGTPIGNLDDASPRVLATLRSADVLLCEDTRVTSKLLARFDIRVSLMRCDQNVIVSRLASVLDRVEAGERVAFVSDAGMPGVSDPGQRLVDAALDAGVAVEVLPGPTAVATAYVASGFTCPRFYFGGFFPRKAGERAQVLQTACGLDAVSLYYESPHRIASALADVAAALPMRRVAVCRELTKLHEETVRGLSGDVAAEFAAREADGGVKGEIVLVIDAPGEQELEQESRDAAASAAERAAQLIAEGALSRKDIVKKLRDEFGISRNEAYELVHGA